MSSNVQTAQNLVMNFQPGATVFYTAVTQAAYTAVITITDDTGKTLATIQGSGIQKFIGQGSFVTSTANVKVTISANGKAEQAMVQDCNVVNGANNYLTGYTVICEDAGDADFNDVTLQLWSNWKNG